MGAAAAAPCCSSAADKHDVSGSSSTVKLSDEQLALKSREPIFTFEIRLVQGSWRQAIRRCGTSDIGVMLFKNIFYMAPEALYLFSFKDEPNILTYETPRLRAHAAKVVGMVSTCVEGLLNLEALEPQLQELGLRHAGYGAGPAHYELVGRALLRALERGLGCGLAEKARVAWSKVWNFISAAMIRGASIEHPSSQGPVDDIDVTLVEGSWKKAAALGVETVGELLFKNIFEIAPEALQLFPFREEPDMYESSKFKAHAAGVVGTVDKAVKSLRDLDGLVPLLQALGRRHVGYGVRPPHYDVVGKALVATLRAGLGGRAFSRDVEASWLRVWNLVATTMIGDNYR